MAKLRKKAVCTAATTPHSAERWKLLPADMLGGGGGLHIHAGIMHQTCMCDHPTHMEKSRCFQHHWGKTWRQLPALLSSALPLRSLLGGGGQGSCSGLLDLPSGFGAAASVLGGSRGALRGLWVDFGCLVCHVDKRGWFKCGTSMQGGDGLTPPAHTDPRGPLVNGQRVMPLPHSNSLFMLLSPHLMHIRYHLWPTAPMPGLGGRSHPWTDILGLNLPTPQAPVRSAAAPAPPTPWPCCP